MRTFFTLLSNKIFTFCFCLAATVFTAQAAALTVTKIADTNDNECNSDCSLREAIAVAAAGDEIVFASPLFDSPQTITLSETNGFRTLTINKNLTINGKGANLLTIERSSSASAFFRIFTIAGGNVALNGMTVSGGRISGSNGFAAGIYNMLSGNLTVNACHVTGNTVISSSGNVLGGGISNNGGRLFINNSTVSNNVVMTDATNAGGGIFTIGPETVIVNTTVSGNTVVNNTDTTSNNNGGGISNFGVTTIRNLTITDNGAVGANSAGGIYSGGGSLSIGGAIVAANRSYTTVPDVAGNTFTSQGYNLVGNRGTVPNFNQPSDQSGDSSSPINPLLQPIGNYGGTTPTRALMSSSPAIDKGNSFGATRDQRGQPRPIDNPSVLPAPGGDNSDIGAFEAGNFAPLVVTKTADTNDGLCSIEDCSLREAIAAAPSGSEIAFASPLFDTPQIITLSDAVGFRDLVINKNLFINGKGANLLTVRRDTASPVNFRIFTVSASLFLNGMTVTGGKVGPNTFSGGIYGSLDSNLTVNACHITDNEVSGSSFRQGGGISSAAATLIINNSTISNNRVNNGSASNPAAGGIYASGSGTIITNSTISGNTVANLGNVSDFNGGGIYNNGLATINNSTVTDNGAVGTNSASGIFSTGRINVGSTIVAKNRNDSTMPDVASSSNIFSHGYNLIGNAGAAVTYFNQTGDQTGNSSSPVNPFLEPLADNGGTTPTHALAMVSPPAINPAIDKGSSFGLAIDQRGATRPVDIPSIGNASGGDGTDIGAFEVQTASSNQPPNANPNSYTVNRNTVLTVSAPGVLVNDTDADGTNLFAALSSGPAHGTVTLDADGSFVYTPNANYIGTDSFTYTANDGTSSSNTATVTITITGGSPIALIVSKTADTNDGVCDADCSLREAIAGSLSGDTIVFSSLFDQPQTITLSETAGFQSLLIVEKNLTITGTGANLLTVRRSPSATALFRIFEIGFATVNISGMTITGGDANGDAGGISIFGSTVTITNCHITGNAANGRGGGIRITEDTNADSVVNIANSTISNNTSNSANASAGGIHNDGSELTITDSTVSGNVKNLGSADSSGGIWTNSTIMITNTTVTDNQADAGNSNGIFTNSGVVTIRNSIIAANRNNATKPDVRGDSFVSGGYNLIGNVGNVTGFTNTGDQIGDSITPRDPRLNSLGDNGGTTPTHSLQTNSPAIDKGNSFGSAIDQRGFPRPYDTTTIADAADGADIGAFEQQNAAAGNHSVSGTVRYGTTPTGDAAKFVPAVTLTADGASQVIAATDATGAYLLSGLGAGAYTVTPTKAAQANNNGISLQDASEAAKIAFNQITPTANQRIAADATGNDSVSLQDASEIAKRAFNIASNNIVGQWKFVPETRSYPSLSSNQTGQDYEAILVGDVTGNWTAPSPAANRPEAEIPTNGDSGEKSFVENRRQTDINPAENNQAKIEQSSARINETQRGDVVVSVPNASGKAATTVLIPVTVGDLTGLGITAYDFTVSFDPRILEPASDEFESVGTLTEAAGNYSVFVDSAQPAGRLRIGAFGTTALSDSGVLIYLRFNVLPETAATSPLDFRQFIFGEGGARDPQATPTNASFTRNGRFNMINFAAADKADKENHKSNR